jgi:predicted transcriptional regulator
MAERGEPPNFREKMEKLAEDLARASAEVDKALAEMGMVSQAREEASKV